jgi:hypothetical protein
VTPDQQLVAGIAMAALTQDHQGLAQLINDCPADKVRDATAHALTVLVAGFRPSFTPHDWQDLINQARASLLLLELDPS